MSRCAMNGACKGLHLLHATSYTAAPAATSRALLSRGFSVNARVRTPDIQPPVECRKVFITQARTPGTHKWNSSPSPFHIGLNSAHLSASPAVLTSSMPYRQLLTTRWSTCRTFASDTKPSSAEVNTKPVATPPSKDGDKLATAASSTGTSSTSKHIFNRLPHIPYIHRPTKEELLAAATGFWHRLQIRFKWFSIRSARPFNSEEILTFISWIFWGHVLWIVIGTTTFVSLGILAINTVFAQETLATWVGSYLTQSIGVKIVFENAIVPNWRDGVITFKNVFISRRPMTDGKRNSIEKGSSADAAAEAALAERARQQALEGKQQDDDGNYTQFDLTVESIAVTLSFTKWFNGKGLLRDVEVRGVRGVLDRTHVKPRREQVDPKTFRRQHKIGDFEIDGFKLDDVLLTIYQPNNFRPFQISVFNCELPRLRKQWLFYDILGANNISGSFDNSLFTIHPRQVHNYSGLPLLDGQDQEPSQWKKHSRLRIDGLKVDHLNRGVDGPFSWIYEGNVDIVADIMIPSDTDGSIAKVMSDFYDRMEATVTNAQAHPATVASNSNNINNQQTSTHNLHQSTRSEGTASTTPLVEPTKPAAEQSDDENRFLILDLAIQLNDVHASVPLFNNQLSYVNNALVRPIVAYINSHSHTSRGSTFIPINCRIVKRRSEFDGSWTVFDCGLLGDVSREVYTAFVRDISDRKHRQRRIKKVGLWAAQVAAQALFIGLAGQLA